MTIRTLLFLAACLFGLFYWRSSHRPLPPPGIVAGAGPSAAAYTQFTRQPTRDGNYSVMPLASYHVRARVLGVKRYRDGGSDVAPYDLALGWGPMSDSAVYGSITMSQRGRSFACSSQNPEAFKAGKVCGNCSNFHVIPANDDVAAAFAKVRDDDVVTVSGAIVQAGGPNGEPLDAGANQALSKGCGLLWVTNLSVE